MFRAKHFFSLYLFVSSWQLGTVFRAKHFA